MKMLAIVKDNFVVFEFFREKTAFYSVNFAGNKFLFPVPIDDIGEGTLLKQDKAIMFMRWIRVAIENGQFLKTSN